MRIKLISKEMSIVNGWFTHLFFLSITKENKKITIKIVIKRNPKYLKSGKTSIIPLHYSSFCLVSSLDPAATASKISLSLCFVVRTDSGASFASF